MVKEVRIYFEGDRALKPAFGTFLKEIKDHARSQKAHWELVACGPRSRAFASFQAAIDDHPDALLVLLVDSEAPVTLLPWQHLREREGDGWREPRAEDSSCHLMVQSMESWFVADMAALKSYYGQGFNEKVVRTSQDVEALDRQKLQVALVQATRNTSKGEYHKTRHAPHILSRLNVAAVRAASKHCDRLFTTLIAKLTA